MIDKGFPTNVIAAVLAAALVSFTVMPANAIVHFGGAGLEPTGEIAPNEYLRLVQSDEIFDESDDYPDDDTGENTDQRELEDYDDAVTRGVAKIIERESYKCLTRLRPEYRIECLAKVYERASSSIIWKRSYRAAGADLRGLSNKLGDISDKYRDPGAPEVTVNGRTTHAVSKANLAQANQEATAAIEETVTKLLRSAGNSEKRKLHYAQIATAVDSTKRLLRS